MAGSVSGMGERFVNFFKKQVPELPSSVEPVREVVFESLATMVPVFVMALRENLPVRLLLGDHVAPFYCFTEFDWELEEDDIDQVVESKTHLEEGRHLLVDTLYPPIGNVKIGHASKITAEFSSKYYTFECVTTLQKITPLRKVRLTFPKVLIRKVQRRASYRVHVEQDLKISLSIVRPSGIAFMAKFRNVSAGGAAFSGAGAIPVISTHARVRMTVTYPEHKFVVDAVVLGNYPRDGTLFFRTQFIIQDQKKSKEINEFVNYVQRQNIQRRKDYMS